MLHLFLKKYKKWNFLQLSKRKGGGGDEGSLIPEVDKTLSFKTTERNC